MQLIFSLDAIVILRFLGTSPDSSNISNLLRSVCCQINVNTGNATSDLRDESFEELVQIFENTVQNYQSKTPLIIFLDSLDQLSFEHSAQKLRWLPKKLGKNVKIILSTYTDSKEVISQLKSFFPAENFCLVPALGEKLSYEILIGWLKAKDRRLTDAQSHLVEETFKACSLPLYVKLVFEHVLGWKSYTPIDQIQLSHNVKDGIDTLFEQLEVKHGSMFVQRAFSYLTASMSGLSELELEDVMSLDDEMLTDIFRFHVPPIRRVPTLLWARLRYDINSYLVDKEVDNTRVSFWYHRQFIEAANERYLSNANHAKKIHSYLADYYMGTWHGKAKPFQYTEKQARKLGLTSVDSSADRKVAAQPLSYTYMDGKKSKVRYNKRKLNKLPTHLSKAGRKEELEKLCLFNYKFLNAKIHACTVVPVLSDYAMCGYEGSLLHKIIKKCQTSLQKFPGSLSFQISGHMLPLLSGKKSTQEKELVSQCLNASVTAEEPIPYVTCYDLPVEALLYKLQHRTIPYGNKLVAISGDSNHVLTLAENNILLSWDLTSGELEREREIFDPNISKLNIMSSNVEKNLMYLASTYQKQANPVVVVNMTTADVVRSVFLGKTYPGVLLTDWLKFAFTDSKVFILSQGEAADVFELDSGKLIHEFNIKADSMQVSNDEKKIIYHVKGGKSFIIYNINSLTKDAEFEVSDIPTSILLTKSGDEALVFFKESGTCEFLNIETSDGKPGKLLCHVRHPRDLQIKGIQMASNGHIMLKIEDGFTLWNYGRNKFAQEFRAPQNIKPDHRVLDFFGILSSDGNYFIMVYEWHIVLWNAKSGKLICCKEISKAQLVLLLADQKDEKIITISKRQNSFSVWKTSSLMESQSAFSPLSLITGPRYVSVARDAGNVALVRGNSAEEVVIVDLKVGKLAHRIAEGRQTYRPHVTADGKHAILKEYTNDGMVDDFFQIWNMESGKFARGLAGDSLQIRHWTYSNTNVALYSETESKPGGEVTVWSIDTGKLVSQFSVENKNKGDMVFMFDFNDKHLMISRYEGNMKSVATCDVMVVPVDSGKVMHTFKSVVSLSFQSLRSSDSLFMGIQFDGEESYTAVMDSKAMKVVRKGQLHRKSINYISVSQDGKLGLDRLLNLYDLDKVSFICTFDTEEAAAMLKQERNHTTTPKLMPNGKHAVWVNLRANLIKIGNIERQEVQSVLPIHTIPLFLEVSVLGLIVVGCEDGRLMILQQPELNGGDSRENRVLAFLDTFIKRLKGAVANVTYTSKSRAQGKADAKKTSSKVCALL